MTSTRRVHGRAGPSRYAVGSAVAACLALAASSPVAAQSTCPGNRLVNGGFEHGFTARSRVTELVAVGWTAWFERLPGVDGLNYPPDYTPRRVGDDRPGTVLEGDWSQELATRGATHTGGAYQTVPLPRGALVRATVAAYAWASEGTDPERSDPPGTYLMVLGIDPRGGTDPGSTAVLWTTPISTTDAWNPLEVTATVSGEAVTVFLRGQAMQRLRNNVSRWDAACLEVLQIPDVEPTVVAATPRPTAGSPPPATLDPAPLTALALQSGLETDVAATVAAATASPGVGVPPPDGEPAGDVVVGAVTPAGSPAGADAEPPEDGGMPEVLGIVFLALAALAAGLVLGLGRRPARPRS